MKKRIDQILVDKKIVSSRGKAKQLIEAKSVLVNNKYILKLSTIIDDSSDIVIEKSNNDYVSRAGVKLEKAIDSFDINVQGLVALDIGSSTGGFTECLLRKGVKLVYALDVGTNQLEWKLRNNDKVISMEKTNFRYCKKADFKYEIDFACCDVSFISLDKIIPNISLILSAKRYAVILIKPQFEAGKGKVVNGKITSKKIHIEVINKIIKLSIENNFSIVNLDYSPITGNKKKNIEFIIQIQKIDINPINNFSNDKIIKIVNDAWIKLLDK